MRYLVTGACGFIGSTLVDRLLAEGDEVIGIDNLSTGVPANLDQALRYNRIRPGKFTFLKADIQATELAGIVDGANPDVVCHLAAQVDLRASVTDPQFDARANVLGTINLLEATRRAGVRRLVYAASGGSRYGAPISLPVAESAPLNPLSPYAVAKVAGEMYIRAYASMYGIAPICLGLSNVYGPRQNPFGEAGVIAVFGSRMISGKPVTVYGDGTATRDYVYVDDVVDAFVRAGRAPLSTVGTYNIGTGQQASVTEVHRAIAAVLDDPAPPCFAGARTGELHEIALDATQARNELGWEPAVDLTEGIERTMRWLRTTLDPEPALLMDA
ncbi:MULTISPECIES: NAD-dependent epimerase/dehydratase family protein [Mycobacteriaceae]|uniref:UDP-glucose 4-epimerase n=1 Tax=Mycolicibacterium neoaurum VKM Ac-1815D TaxID=700508 RepID=V5XGE4_MYCNE|nr:MULTISPECIES: NAD-dependent epimerase/dehydratase family protein [Mycobacteriaceae]AHC27495.1 UDP-glucose 4-epimerase [Mycolicibacterium neoaurum VKM Ac-1815D]AMO07699.1 UDP-glucose 4-epimerase [Mycolicibacterium neoaurum]AXK73900.1 NAD-dependent epimerase/dehydratase family protein [Mycolicibacterium neoaurum]KJQ51649.1 UDP-glucose 4-epimerase [Mycolicibacterium neoaurum]KUM06306.1 UDP-glucose 4-epimerase [Mycolicibacterium neoaurum]